MERLTDRIVFERRGDGLHVVNRLPLLPVAAVAYFALLGVLVTAWVSIFLDEHERSAGALARHESDSCRTAGRDAGCRRIALVRENRAVSAELTKQIGGNLRDDRRRGEPRQGAADMI